MLVRGMGGVGRDQHGVAVGRSPRCRLRRHHPLAPALLSTITACLVSLGDRCAERPCQLVGGAAGGERHDEGDRPLRVLALRPGRGRGEGGEQRRGEKGAPLGAKDAGHVGSYMDASRVASEFLKF
jgi:hypothetical protein